LIGATQLADGAVLGELLGDDGAGSGLDADLLDGLNSTAFALAAHTHSGADIVSGTVADARIAATIARDSEIMTIVLAGDGPGSGLDADLLDGLSSSALWQLGGNAGTTPGAQFLGTTDNQPLEIKVNGMRALRLEPTGDSTLDPDILPDGAPNVIGGAPNNVVAAGVVGATIAGGGATNLDGFARPNSIAGNYATIGGGLYNTIQTNAATSTIGGGWFNTIQTNADYSTIGGGRNNTIQPNTFSSTIGGGGLHTIQPNANFSTIGGGERNTIQPNASYSTIGGGATNTIQTRATNSTIGGGGLNTIQTNALYATIPGGELNSATNYAFAAGRRAKANHTGSFVWGDASNFDFPSTATNEFSVRATGGVRFVTGISAGGAPTAGVSLTTNDVSWNTISDRNAKKNFRPADGREILDQLARVPIQRWNYKWEADEAVPHLGPMAQDFKAAFYPGRDHKSISTLEADGVALAAIQGLNQKVEQELRARDVEIRELKRTVSELNQLVRELAARKEVKP
jgi:hypothetical protein